MRKIPAHGFVNHDANPACALACGAGQVSNDARQVAAVVEEEVGYGVGVHWLASEKEEDGRDDCDDGQIAEHQDQSLMALSLFDDAFQGLGIVRGHGCFLA